MEQAESRVHMPRAPRVSQIAARAYVPEWVFPAASTVLCLLALSALLSPATFGPIGALMLLVLVVGVATTLGVPAYATPPLDQLRSDAQERAADVATTPQDRA